MSDALEDLDEREVGAEVRVILEHLRQCIEFQRNSAQLMHRIYPQNYILIFIYACKLLDLRLIFFSTDKLLHEVIL